MTSPFFMGNQDVTAHGAYGTFSAATGQTDQQNQYSGYGSFTTHAAHGATHTGHATTQAQAATTMAAPTYGYAPNQQMDTWTNAAAAASYGGQSAISAAQQQAAAALYGPSYNQPQNYGPIGGPVPTGGRGMGGRGRGMGRGGRGMYVKPKPVGPKVIKATEIKAWLFEWCTQKKLKPEYSYEAKGKYPKVKYICTLKVSGIDHETQNEAKNKKEAQTMCAWDFCEELVKKSYVNQSDLPKKPSPEASKTEKKNETVSSGGSGAQVGTQAQPPTNGTSGVSMEVGSGEFGGWTADNARRRLNEFCMEERISCEFETSSQGSLYSHIATSKLTLNIKRLGYPLEMTAQDSNKKKANATCALLMVRKLFELGLIERFGENRMSPGTTKGQKRKAEHENESENGDEAFDETGNWTLELARSRLSEFFQKQGQQLNCDEKEFGGPFNKQFQCQCSIALGEKTYSAQSIAGTKKGAQKKCALDMVIQLYKAKLIPGNTGKRVGITAKEKDEAKRQKKSRERDENRIFLTGRVVLPRWGTGRTTPMDDRHITAKLETLEQSEEEKAAIDQVVQKVEGVLKIIADKLATAEPAPEVKVETEAADSDVEMKDGTEKPAESKQRARGPLLGCDRIGPYSKGTMLKGESNPQLLLQCRDKPTVTLLRKIAKAFQDEPEAEGFVVGTNIRNASIEPVKEVNGIRVPVQIIFTSTKLRLNPEQLDETPDPADILPKNKCLEALAEQRRAKFFQAKAAQKPNAVAICRLLKNMMLNDSDWAGLSEWAMELIVQKAFESAGVALTAGDLLRRVFASISSGLFLPGGSGINDPCERERVDVSEKLSKQMREDITYKAQHVLRLLSFMQIHVVLGIEKMEKP